MYRGFREALNWVSLMPRDGSLWDSYTSDCCYFFRPVWLSLYTPCGRGAEYAQRYPACRMRWLNGCPDGSASTVSDYAGLLYNFYSLGWRNRDVGPKCCHYSQTSRAQSPLNPFYTWYNHHVATNMLLTGLHQSPVVSIPLLLPSNLTIIPLQPPTLLPLLTCTKVRAIIINNNIHVATLYLTALPPSGIRIIIPWHDNIINIYIS